jgi:general secretion pathway protein G
LVDSAVIAATASAQPIDADTSASISFPTLLLSARVPAPPCRHHHPAWTDVRLESPRLRQQQSIRATQTAVQMSTMPIPEKVLNSSLPCQTSASAAPTRPRVFDSTEAQRGFTLLELLVVMVIIGLLAGIVAPQYFAQLGKSNAKVARAQIESFGQALDQYRLDVGQYPTTEQGLAALRTAPQGQARWQGPYLKREIPNDPWRKPYVYQSPGQHGEYDLSSLGSDGQAGGEGEAADVVSW